MAGARDNAVIHVYLAASCAATADGRWAAIEAVIAAGHAPGGSGATGGGLPPATLGAWLRRSDLVVVIVGDDDGPESDSDDGGSLVAWELAEARAAGLPILAIALADGLLGGALRPPLAAAKRERVAALRDALLGDGGDLVDSLDQLRLALFAGLQRHLVDPGRPRWVREDRVTVARGLAEELARLSAEAAALRAQARGPHADAPRLADRMIAGIRAEHWVAALMARKVRDLRSRQPRPLAQVLSDHAAALALGVGNGDKAPPLEHWLFGEVGAQLVAMGLASLEEGPRAGAARIRLSDAGCALMPLLALAELEGEVSEETVVATSDSGLRARIAGASTAAGTGSGEEEKTNFWSIDAPAGRRPGKP